MLQVVFDKIYFAILEKYPPTKVNANKLFGHIRLFVFFKKFSSHVIPRHVFYSSGFKIVLYKIYGG